MKTLSELLAGIRLPKTLEKAHHQILSIHCDSREVREKSLFVAIQGVVCDGHDFINEAVTNGAEVIIHDKHLKEKISGITYIKVSNSRATLALIAHNFFDKPSKKIKLVGVTGTNGKTTTATLLFELFRKLGYPCALLSTIENKINEKTYPSVQTTPNPIAIASFLKQAVESKCQYAFMECSSHAIEQNRVLGLDFTGAIFTNLTQDHLDYHQTMPEYARAKKRLFDNLAESAFAVANRDDAWGEYMLSDTKAQKYFFSLKDKIVQQSTSGLIISWDDHAIKSKLIGTFNASNLLGIYTMATLLDIPEAKILPALALLNPPSGRLEFISGKKGINGIIDYAHTPDALEKVLKTIRDITPNSKIITVVGCGGERDVSKRPLMGKIAFELSDYVVFSSDNPKSEDPKKILRDMVVKLPVQENRYECEIDRAKAIQIAFRHASRGDVILLAGKGHEDYQFMANGKIPFSEKREWAINAN